MREASAQTRALVADGTPARTWVADLMYDGERRMSNVLIADVDLSWDGGSFVAGSGSLRVIWSDDHGRSMVPRQIGDWFSPFGAELQIDCIVGIGVFAERVPQGRFVIESVPNAIEAEILWQSRRIHSGESFTVNLKDGMHRILRDPFPFPTSSQSSSVWAEIQAITGMPVIQSVDDATIAVPVTHDEDRSTALSKLFDRLGAWPQLTGAGVLTARPKAWPAPVDALTGVVSAPRALTSALTYNRVVVEGKSPAGEPIYATAEIRDGYLRVLNADGSRSPFGVATYTYRSEYLTTVAQCQGYADELLPRVSRVRGVTREVTERFNPLREVGDVLTYDGGVVRVMKVSHSEAVTNLTVEVPDE